MGQAEGHKAQKKALSLFRSGIVGSTLVEEKGAVATPIPVRDPEGEFASWFVPIIVADRIAGFFQFSPRLDLLRYASLQKEPESVDDCPTAASWIDPETVKNRAKILATDDEVLSSPYLTYDANISRLAWAVRAMKHDGGSRLIYVAGDYVYPERDRSRGPETGKAP